jgi:subtilase family serine protease
MGSELWPSRIVGVVAWLVFFACDVDGAVASHAIDSCSEMSACLVPLAQADAFVHSTTALSEAIHQNTGGNSQGYPLGLSWNKGVYGTHTLTPAPSGFSALTGWGIVYQEAGSSVSPNAANATAIGSILSSDAGRKL